MHGQPRLHPAIPQPVRQLLAELELISHGSTQSWNSAGGSHGESTAVLPYGESNPPHITLRVAYLKQTSDEGRAAVLIEIRRELDTARGQVDRSHVVGETLESEDARIVQMGEGFTVDEVALQFNCTPTRVRKARLAADRRADNGTPVRRLDEHADPRREAVRMKGDGMTVRQIALALGRQPSTIGVWVKAA